mmetsp:Transcript_55787/g.103198  ORF Transcript_55787/g.103198 Transcript_55787/m.103198 type:complete len:625 (-) Transcript_55787:36-1910(-)
MTFLPLPPMVLAIIVTYCTWLQVRAAQPAVCETEDALGNTLLQTALSGAHLLAAKTTEHEDKWTEQEKKEDEQANASDVGDSRISPDLTSPLSLLRSHRNSSTMHFTTGYMGYEGASQQGVASAFSVTGAPSSLRRMKNASFPSKLAFDLTASRRSHELPLQLNAPMGPNGADVYFAATTSKMAGMADGLLSAEPVMRWYRVARALWTMFRPARGEPGPWDWIPTRIHANYSNPFGVRPLKMEVHLPRERPPASGWPVIFNLPGGKWGITATTANYTGAHLNRLFKDMNNFALVSIDLRDQITPEIYPYPEAILHPAELEDALAGLKYMWAHAAEWHLDPDRVVLHGFSSGGHIASLAAVTTTRQPELVDGRKVMAVILEAAPSDFLLMLSDEAKAKVSLEGHGDCSSAESTVIGCGSIHSVSLDDVIDTLAYARALHERAGFEHKIQLDLQGLAKMQESEVMDEILTGLALATLMKNTSTLQGVTEEEVHRVVMDSYELQARAANLTRAVMTVVAASPTVQVMGAHLEGHSLPPFFIHNQLMDEYVPPAQSSRMVQALQQTGTDFTFFQSQFGAHSDALDFVRWPRLLFQFSTAVGKLAIQEDLLRLLPVWLQEHGFVVDASA